jgi:hypothetical protein
LIEAVATSMAAEDGKYNELIHFPFKPLKSKRLTTVFLE